MDERRWTCAGGIFNGLASREQPILFQDRDLGSRDETSPFSRAAAVSSLLAMLDSSLPPEYAMHTRVCSAQMYEIHQSNA